MTLSDEDRLQHLVALTAEFRYRISWRGARALLQARDIDPMRVVQLTCDQGFDVNTTLMLPDGVLVNVDFSEDPKSREYTSIFSWEVENQSSPDIELARQIVNSRDRAEFDRRVQQYFDKNWRDKDAPLPAKPGT